MNLFEKLNRLDDNVSLHEDYPIQQDINIEKKLDFANSRNKTVAVNISRKPGDGTINLIREWCARNNKNMLFINRNVEPSVLEQEFDVLLVDEYTKLPRALQNAINDLRTHKTPIILVLVDVQPLSRYGVGRLAKEQEKLSESFDTDKEKLLTAAESVKCKLDEDTIEYAMYDVDDFIENELTFVGNMLLEEHPEMLFWKYGDDSDNNFGGYFEVYESDDEYPDAYYQIVHDRLYDITDEVNGDYDYDDDIDEMLTESELTNREKLMNTYPDDFGHWEPYNRDPETKKIDTSTTSNKELGARQKLRNAFPDLNIPYADSDEHENRPLKEAIKDTDYVIVLTHPNMPQDKRYSYFGSNYRMTRDLNKAMTYPGEFSAKDEIKYALDATDGHWDPLYADRFSVMTIAQVKELLNTPKPEKVSRAVHHNPSAQEAAKPIAKEIHEVIKKHNVSLSSFLKLITEIVKSEDPNA